MSPRYEPLMFRLGLVGLVLVLGVFGYKTVTDPAAPGGGAGPTSTTSASDVATTTTTPPPLKDFTVLSPRDETHVAEPEILLAGVGNPGSVVARGGVATNVDSRGVWSLRLTLVAGANELEVVETAPDGSVLKATLTVHYDV